MPARSACGLTEFVLPRVSSSLLPRSDSLGNAEASNSPASARLPWVARDFNVTIYVGAL
jgi:hypothetical protein